MNAEMYDALIAAGAPEEKARAAAKAVAESDGRFSKIEAELLVIKWMCGFIIAGVAALILRSFF